MRPFGSIIKFTLLSLRFTLPFGRAMPLVYHYRLVVSSVFKGYFMKNKISYFRKQKGLTQPQLAELAKLTSYTLVQRYERGARVPCVDIAIRLARALDTTVEELFIVDDD